MLKISPSMRMLMERKKFALFHSCTLIGYPMVVAVAMRFICENPYDDPFGLGVNKWLLLSLFSWNILSSWRIWDGFGVMAGRAVVLLLMVGFPFIYLHNIWCLLTKKGRDGEDVWYLPKDGQGRGWMTKDEAEAFIGGNAGFYMCKWKRHAGDLLKGWNWAAGIFCVEWMAYRKMWAEALICISAILVASVFLGNVFDDFGIGMDGRMLGGAFRIAMGVFGNLLYREKALRTLRRCEGLPMPERLRFMSVKGGVSLVGLVVSVNVQIACGCLLAVYS